ncbi:MAG: TOPRIM nucleotidyl transferase/hydrolase domain-containing protein [Actinomycetota bacterium]
MRWRSPESRRILDTYAHGPDAPVDAELAARARADAAGAEALILVEGVSDQVAIETAAARLGRHLDEEGVVVVPVGGFGAIAGFLREYGPGGRELDIAGLCDADAGPAIERTIEDVGLEPFTASDGLMGYGWGVCRRDLEEELIRAAGPERMIDVIEAEGELRSFQTLQKQAAWDGHPVEEQLHRFIRSRARRGTRYAALLTDAMDIDRIPAPLLVPLDAV